MSGERAIELLDERRRSLLDRLRDESRAPVELVADARTGTILSLTLQVTPEGGSRAEQAAAFVAVYQELLDPYVISEEYTLAPQDPSCREGAMVLDRIVNGLPVLGSRLTLHFDLDGAITSVTNGVASAPAERVEVDPRTIEGAVPVEEIFPRDYEGEPTRTAVLVPSPDLRGLFEAELLQWLEPVSADAESSGTDATWGPTHVRVGVVALNGIAITGKLTMTGGDYSNPPITVYAPKYLDKDGLPLPEFITYRELGGLTVARFPWEQDPVEMAYRFLEEHPSLMRTFAARCQYAPKQLVEDPNVPGVYFVRLTQKYGPLPVFGAELVVMQEGVGRVMSIAGRTLSSIEAATSPSISAAEAVDATDSELLGGAQQDPAYEAQVRDALQRPAAVTLGVLPAHLQDPSVRTRERLAYQVNRGAFVMYVDADTAQVLTSRSLHVPANIVTDANQGTEWNMPFLNDEIDGIPTGAFNPRSFDNLPTRAGGNAGTGVAATAAFLASLGWMGPANAGGDFKIHTNVNITTGCPNAFFDGVFTHETFYCNGVATTDVIGHEFAHGVIHASSNLWYLDQSGAINEAYADLIGNLIFPDAAPGGWQVGELIGGGGTAFRDMANPVVDHMSTYIARSAAAGCTLLPWSCDFGFVHTNSGIINRAHVLLADGINQNGVQLTPGIGRSKLKMLAFLTMTRRLPMDARMNDVPVATRDICDMLVGRQASDETGSPFTVGDCDQVLHAFNQVGLNGKLDSGWQEPVLAQRGTRTFKSGETTPGGCAVTNVSADWQTLIGTLTADLSPTTPQPTLLDPFFGTQTVALRVIGSTSNPFPLGTSSMVHTVDWTNNFGWEPKYGTRVANVASCAPATNQVERVSGVFFHSHLLGHSGLDRIGPTSSSMDLNNCFVRQTDVELLDSAGNRIAGPGQAVTHRVSHCAFNVCVPFDQNASIAAPPPIAGGDLSALVRWNYDAGRGPIRIRLRYTIDQFNGVTCLP